MTSEEALKILTESDSVGVRLILANDPVSMQYNAKVTEAWNMALKALEEQTKDRKVFRM